jgi:hypothetical protein
MIQYLKLTEADLATSGIAKAICEIFMLYHCVSRESLQWITIGHRQGSRRQSETTAIGMRHKLAKPDWREENPISGKAAAAGRWIQEMNRPPATGF